MQLSPGIITLLFESSYSQLHMHQFQPSPCHNHSLNNSYHDDHNNESNADTSHNNH